MSPEPAPEEPPSSDEDGSRAGLLVTIVSAWGWFSFGLCVALWCVIVPIVWLVTAPFDRDHYWPGYVYRRMPSFAVRLNPLWKFRYSGNLPANPRNPYVVVSNHESFVDILLITVLPWEMKWLSKREMFKVPFAGWLMKLSNDIPLDRGDSGSASRAMKRCRELLGRKMSVMIFPEGTRSSTDEMRDFKDGAFRLAIDAQVPILPLVVCGTRPALRKHDWRMGRSDAEVHVMEPVTTEGLGSHDVGELRDRVRSLIEAQRDEMRAAAS
ncbi:MAG: lysophospholipid acyltransferase family protein [Microthrixaceae bacterium]